MGPREAQGEARLISGVEIAVLGAGAVGVDMGGLLSANGLNVTLIGRSERVEPIASQGLTILRPNAEPLRVRPSVAVSGDRIPNRFDVVLLTVKAYDVAGAISPIRSLLRPTGVVIPFQNGVGSDAHLVKEFGVDAVVPATSTVSVSLDSAGCLTHHNEGGGVAWSSYGSIPDGIDFTSWLEGYLPTTRVPRADGMRWSKLLLNDLGSAQAAILKMDVIDILRDPAGFEIERRSFNETICVMRAAGIPMLDLPGYPVRLAAKAMRLPAFAGRTVLASRAGRGRGGKPPGLRQDLESGRGRTEIEFLNGAVADAGTSLGVPTPVNRTLTDLVLDATSNPGTVERFRNDPGQLLGYILRR